MKKVYLFNILFLITSLSANTVATITALSGNTNIQRQTQSLTASLGAKIEEKDTLITKDNTKIQLIFKDNTIISIGKNSNFSVEEYLFEDGEEPIAKFGMFKGAIRTITGKIGKIAPQKFTVATKTATIGIRGTHFSIIIADDGSYQTYCSFGEISVSVKDEMYSVEQGFSLLLSVDGEVTIKEVTHEDLLQIQEQYFTLSPQKNGITQTAQSMSQEDENNEQLNLTVTDSSASLTQDVNSVSSQGIQQDSFNTDPNIPTDNSVIAGYSMTNASYAGTYTTTTNTNANFLDSGSASLAIDFGADTATLTLGAPTLDLLFSSTNVSSNTFSLIHIDNALSPTGNGTADGAFYGTTGNNVQGSFNYLDGGGQSTGSYTTTSSQALH